MIGALTIDIELEPTHLMISEHLLCNGKSIEDKSRLIK